MANQISSTLESRLKNNKDLVILIKNYSDYLPTSDDIKKENFEQFVNDVDNAIYPFKNAKGGVTSARINNNVNIEILIDAARNVRYEVLEVKGKKSAEYFQVDNIVKMITGENINEHSLRIKNKLNPDPEGNTEVNSSSVAQTDIKSRTGNFRELIELLKNFEFYNPSDKDLSVEALEAIHNKCISCMIELTEAESKFTNERSRIIHYFDNKGGLKDRAVRAKAHVKRKYGNRSPEYKALVNKKY